MAVGACDPSVGPEGHTLKKQTAGSKQIKAVFTDRAQPADIGPAPTSRVYDKDYSKVRDKSESDMVGPFLGNPLRW